ncbi:hypothetical protein FB451DRAFT_1283354 [Mycena latifolia]|nr:hypothetical protein FB451DRAFT_1283354 [Mycena latifolia]
MKHSSSLEMSFKLRVILLLQQPYLLLPWLDSHGWIFTAAEPNACSNLVIWQRARSMSQKQLSFGRLPDRCSNVHPKESKLHRSTRGLCQSPLMCWRRHG